MSRLTFAHFVLGGFGIEGYRVCEILLHNYTKKNNEEGYNKCLAFTSAVCCGVVVAAM